MHEINTKLHTVQDVPHEQWLKYHREQQVHNAERDIARLQAEYAATDDLDEMRRIDAQMLKLYAYLRDEDL